MVSLPTTEFLPVLERCRKAPDLLHVEVANEGDGAGICAGTWLGGRRAALIVENHGLLLASYALTRCQATFGIPTVLIVSYRGHFDERFWWFNEVGRVTEPLLAALGIPARIVHRPERDRTRDRRRGPLGADFPSALRRGADYRDHRRGVSGPRERRRR